MEMLVLYRRMWIRYKILDALQHNPQTDLDELTDWTEKVADEGLKPVFDAIEAGKDVLDALRSATKEIAPPTEPLNR
jgi:hypothetical protein